MKKLFVLLFALTLLSGCVKKDVVEVYEPVETPPLSFSSQAEEGKVVGEALAAKDTSSVTEDFSVVSTAEYDFNGDGFSDTVTLYSNAQTTQSGKFMWEDFHQWILEVNISDDEYYTLFNGSVSTGQLYFELSEIYNDDVEPAITTFLTTSSSLDIEQFTFDGQCFIKKIVYSTEAVSKSGINRVFSSIPSYK